MSEEQVVIEFITSPGSEPRCVAGHEPSEDCVLLRRFIVQCLTTHQAIWGLSNSKLLKRLNLKSISSYRVHVTRSSSSSDALISHGGAILFEKGSSRTIRSEREELGLLHRSLLAGWLTGA